MKTKQELDILLKEHKAQPVSLGYMDIIVQRENYKKFVLAVLEAGFPITCISWWEYIPELTGKNKFGYGGPHSTYYSGWFAELCHGDDDLSQEGAIAEKVSDADRVIKRIEEKALKYPNDISITYSSYPPLTPSFDLQVPEDWKSN